MSANTPVVKSQIKYLPILITVLVLASALLGYLVITPLPSVRSGASVSENVSNLHRGQETYAARYTALAQQHAAKEASIINTQRYRDAETLRYNAMADAFAAKEAANIKRGWDAYAARLTAMDHASTNNFQRGRDAYAARYTAMAEAFATKETTNIQRGWEAYAARLTAMAKMAEHLEIK